MAVFSFTPFPGLETQRLYLRQLSLDDQKEIYLLRSDEEVNQYIDRPRAHSTEDAESFIKKITAGTKTGGYLYWAIQLKTGAGLIGTISLGNLSPEDERAELGYELLPQHQGKGYMQEAVLEITRFGFTIMQLKTIEAWSRAENYRSVKLLEKNNFKRDKNAEARMNADDRMMGIVVYSILNPSLIK
jgi:[ribosomal protein S5]-alanine N-acetyltransferase